MIEKPPFCEWNPENMYYLFVDRAIDLRKTGINWLVPKQMLICSGIREDGLLLLICWSTSYMSSWWLFTTQLKMSQIGLNIVKLWTSKIIETTYRCNIQYIFYCQMDEDIFWMLLNYIIYNGYIYVLSKLYLLSIEYYIHCILYTHICISYVYINI